MRQEGKGGERDKGIVCTTHVDVRMHAHTDTQMLGSVFLSPFTANTTSAT